MYIYDIHTYIERELQSYTCNLYQYGYIMYCVTFFMTYVVLVVWIHEVQGFECFLLINPI